MKKMILALIMMIGFIHFSTAQKPVVQAKPATKTITQAKPAARVTAATPPGKATTVKEVKPVVKAVAVAPAKPVNAQGVVLKKDGTPDKRYNNVAAKPKAPLKKDGTPDMRFKSNKKSK